MTRLDRNKYAGILLLFIFILLAILLAGVALSLRTDPVEERIKNNEVMNTLFVVEDGGNALVTEIFMYYPVYQRGAMFEIPGNTGAIYSSIDRTDRIDAVYNERGIQAYRSEIENLTKIDIPFTVVLTVDNFCQLADILDGIKVFVPNAVDITEEDGTRRLLPHGAISLDGDKLQDFLYYALPDENESDISARRQEAFISFLSALNKNGAQMLEKKNFRQMHKLFSSNLKRNSLNLLLKNISYVDGEQITPNTIIGYEETTSDGIKVWTPLYGGQLVRDTISMMTTSLISSDETSFSRTYALRILNGTSTQGFARNTSILLRGVGYDILATGNADSSYEKTTIVNHLGVENESAAKSLGDFIHCTNIFNEEAKSEDESYESGSNVDLTLILGRDFDGRYVR